MVELLGSTQPNLEQKFGGLFCCPPNPKRHKNILHGFKLRKANLLGYPFEIWLIVFAAVLVRVGIVSRDTILSSIITVVVGITVGIYMHMPVLNLLGLTHEWIYLVAVLVTLTAENLMRSVVSISRDAEFLKSIFRNILETWLKK